jgi:ABC-type multidrug transport system fused ATPase/permease subunit
MSRFRRSEQGDAPKAVSMASRVNLLIGDRRKTVVALAITSVLSGFAEASVLAVVAQLGATVVKGNKHLNLSIGFVHVHSVDLLIAIALGLAIARMLLQFPLSILPAKMTADVQASLRTRLFDAFTRASWSVQSAEREGQLQEVMTSQVMQATGGSLQATSLVTSSATFTVLLAFAFLLNAIAAAGVLVAAVAMFALLRPLRSIGVERSRDLSAAQVGYAGGIAEASRVAEETHVFGVAAAQRERIGDFVGRARELFYRAQVIAKLVPALYQSLIYVVLVLALAVLYAVGRSHAASLGAVILVVVRAGAYGQQVQSSYQGLSQSMPFIERTQAAGERYVQSRPVEGVEALSSIETLAFEDISFAYTPGRPVLSDISFKVRQSEAIGVIGPSGAGKSTLVQILLQLRPPSTGRYLVNDVPVECFARKDWHRLVAYVPQEPRLLHATVAENIRYFRDVDDASVERAAKLARIHDDVMNWAHGYATTVGPRADAVSGGQQQRICLARALVARPEVLVLDEPTSALDPLSETLIQESLEGLKSELTLFVIAHRMSTLDMCDRVMVILDGRLVAFDTKALLQEHNSYYRSASTIAAGSAGGSLP